MPATAPRIALIHATPLAMEPIQAAFQRHWPQVRVQPELPCPVLSSPDCAVRALMQRMSHG